MIYVQVKAIQRQETADYAEAIRQLQQTVVDGFRQQKNFGSSAVIVLSDRIEQMEKELQQLRREVQFYRCAEVSDPVAKQIILEFLKKRKEEGKTTINVFEIQRMANIPLEQASRITADLEKEGKLINEEE